MKTLSHIFWLSVLVTYAVAQIHASIASGDDGGVVTVHFGNSDNAYKSVLYVVVSSSLLEVKLAIPPHIPVSIVDMRGDDGTWMPCVMQTIDVMYRVIC